MISSTDFQNVRKFFKTCLIKNNSTKNCDDSYRDSDRLARDKRDKFSKLTRKINFFKKKTSQIMRFCRYQEIANMW